MKKPKGYWIEFNDDKSDVVYDYNQRGFIPKETDIHVVEYSAYQELEQKLNKAIEALKYYAGENQEIWNIVKEIKGK